MKLNNKYTIVIGSPLLRPGLSIETECSESYLAPVIRKLLELIREFNSEEDCEHGQKSEDGTHV